MCIKCEVCAHTERSPQEVQKNPQKSVLIRISGRRITGRSRGLFTSAILFAWKLTFIIAVEIIVGQMDELLFAGMLNEYICGSFRFYGCFRCEYI